MSADRQAGLCSRWMDGVGMCPLLPPHGHGSVDVQSTPTACIVSVTAYIVSNTHAATVCNTTAEDTVIESACTNVTLGGVDHLQVCRLMALKNLVLGASGSQALQYNTAYINKKNENNKATSAPTPSQNRSSLM